jgi:cell wall-associated NlpC family hydrolase
MPPSVHHRPRIGVRLATASWFLTLFGVLLLVACARSPSVPGPAPRATQAAPAHLANAVLMRAIGLVGTPYRWGGNTPDGGFDCSGLVGFVFRDAAGLALPRSADEIARVPSPRLRRDQLAAGDLVLFGSRQRIDHIGIYVGDRRFVHAPSSGGTVRLDPLDGPYWAQRFVGGQRLLR